MSFRVLGLAVAVAACRDGSSATPAKTSGSADLTTKAVRAPVAPSLGSDPRPALPEPTDDAGPTPTQDQRFAEEPVDRAWKQKTEAELAKRLAPVPNIKRYECHETQCLIVIAGSEHDVGKSVSALESDHAMHELARNVVLTAPTRNTDGTIELHAYAQFER
jgi:hypothetical protein